MADLDGQDPAADPGSYRIIGDRPYLLIEFVPDSDGVNIEVCGHGIDADLTPDGICDALLQVAQAISEAHTLGINGV